MTELSEKLARLSAAATDENLTDGGRYFEDCFVDLCRCRHGETGEYLNDADGELIEELWNAYRSGDLVVRQPAATDTAAVVEALELVRSFGCPRCNGDCGSANPPVMACPMDAIDTALASLKETRDAN